MPELKHWLENKFDYTRPLLQNEMLQSISNNIVRSIASSVRASGSVALIVDGTQDASKKEQLTICVRYVDDQLFPHEVFVGMYEPPTTSGKDLAKVCRMCSFVFNCPLLISVDRHMMERATCLVITKVARH